MESATSSFKGDYFMEETPKKKRAYTKSRLIKELAFRAGITQNQSKAALEAIIEIAYREAKANYFILPGLCKFDVVRREPRKVRNPITGEQLMLPARDALHVVLSKRAKETVAPRVAPMKLEEYNAKIAQEKAAEEAERQAAEAAEKQAAAEAEKKAAEAAVAAESAPPIAVPAEQASTTETPAAKQPVAAENPPSAEQVSSETKPDDGFVDAPEVKGDQAISFKCTTCGQEIVAPLETIGYEAECPACGAILLVPDKSEPGTTYAPGGDGEKKEIVSAQEIEDMNPAALKTRTIRIDALLFDDDANKSPAPSPDAKTAELMKSRTMRIDLPDEF